MNPENPALTPLIPGQEYPGLMKCAYCGNDARLVTGAEVYPHRPDLHARKFWRCKPCKAYVGCHKNSDAVPLGRLANAELRLWKGKAHAAFDPLWEKEKGVMTRSAAYRWLREALKMNYDECHIGEFDVEQCKAVVHACSAYRRKLREGIKNA